MGGKEAKLHLIQNKSYGSYIPLLARRGQKLKGRFSKRYRDGVLHYLADFPAVFF